MRRRNFLRITVLIFCYIIILIKLDLLYLECSALNGENIEEAFNLLGKNIIQKIEEGIIVLDDNPLKKLIKPTIDEEIQNDDANKYKCASC